MYHSLLTGKSFVELVRYIFSLSDVKSFLSQRLCQDPLENFFGRQRQRGGSHDNPNVKEFIHNTQALRVAQSVKVKKGNCRGGEEEKGYLRNREQPAIAKKATQEVQASWTLLK